MTASVAALHTVEGTWDSAIRAFEQNNSWPHELFEPATGRAVQFLPFTETARALRNMTGGVETNRRESDGLPGPDVVQVEIVGYAAEMPNLPDADRRRLAEYVTDLCRRSGVPLEFNYPFTGNDGYGLDGSVRLTPEEWLTARGVLGHCHVPENKHWDPGDISWLPPLVRSLTPASVPEDDMAPDEIRDGHLTDGSTINDRLLWTNAQVDAIKARVDALAAPGIDYDLLATKVADKLAARLAN